MGDNLDAIQQRMNKENVLLHAGILLSFLKNDVMKFTGKWMELLKKIIPSEVAQTQKDKCGIWLYVDISC